MKDGYKLIPSVNTMDEVLEIARTYGNILQQADDPEGKGYVEISTRLGLNKNAYSHDALNVHTDRCVEEIPPRYLLMWYEEVSVSGGEAVLFQAFKHFKDKHDHLCELFTSENSDVNRVFPIYDKEKGIYRFRNDNLTYVATSDIKKFEALLELVEKHQFCLETKSKDCLIVDNWKVLHGRKPFEGDRVAYRILVE